MIFSPQIYIYAGLILFGSIGWLYGHYESKKYDDFVAKVNAEAIAAKAIADRTNAWNNQVIKETNDAYKKRLDAINAKYGGMHDSPTSGKMSGTNTGENPARTIGTPADYVSLERDCTLTTNTLVTLQEILKDTKER